MLTIHDLEYQREMILDDLLCILEELDDETLDRVYSVVEDRFQVLIEKHKAWAEIRLPLSSNLDDKVTDSLKERMIINDRKFHM
jgi:hypothetical protein